MVFGVWWVLGYPTYLSQLWLFLCLTRGLGLSLGVISTFVYGMVHGEMGEVALVS